MNAPITFILTLISIHALVVVLYVFYTNLHIIRLLVYIDLIISNFLKNISIIFISYKNYL